MQIVQWISNNYIEIFGAVTGIMYVFLEIRQNLWLWPVGIITSAVYIYVFFTGKLYADMSLQGYYLLISVIGWYWWSKGTGHRAQRTEQGAEGDLRESARSAGKRRTETGDRRPEEKGGDEGRGRQGAKLEERSDEIPRIGRRSSATAEGSDFVRNDISEAGDIEIKLKVTRVKPVTAIILGIVFLLLYAAMWVVLDNFTDSPVPGFDSFITSLSIVATWMLARKIYEHWFLWIVVNLSASILFFTRELYPTVILYIVYCVMSFAGLIEWNKSLKTNT